VKYGQMTSSIAQFWAGETPGQWLRDADPEAAEALAAFWKAHANQLEAGQGDTVGVLVDRFEWDVAHKVADILRELPAATRRERLNAMSASRRTMVYTALGGTRNG
jgi:hypothetical protein